MAKIGLEIHAYLNLGKNRTKLFCECPINYQEAESNTNICPICTSQPGSKPMAPNKDALDKVIAIGLLLNCKINKKFFFQRKHYDWPDLPSGYQRTISGSYSTNVGSNGKFLNVGIWEVHLEEDPARWDPQTGEVDYNRSGMPLIEIVTAPDLKTPDEARNWLRNLMTTLNYIKAVLKGIAIKADVNVSVEGHSRVEVKNVNSFRNVCKAIEYEFARQEKALKNKSALKKEETRMFDEAEGITKHMRFKEQADDYRFIPEP
ncbi:Asp-tRNA(Asn)/Glu-tRNA(Gln) amidotransferase GatCAB subunit B, partial [Candidatus Woesearchaeota archaeon]|nr:Asp-tRNA(Asn)/Glu-tRNA(Gln) amidotransferase GatCAB subunit B [Candidatus Woesearchaeota archaeon]